MAVVERTDIAENGLSRLLPQFSESTKLRGLVKSLLTGIQPSEDTLFEVLEYTGIETAVGDQLDVIGKLMVVNRDGDNDEDYRDRIYSKIIVNAAKGTPESMLSMVRLATGSDDIILNEYFPAEVHILVQGGRELPDDFLYLASPLGVGTYVSVADEDDVVWTPSEEGFAMLKGVLPEEGETTNMIIAEEIN